MLNPPHINIYSCSFAIRRIVVACAFTLNVGFCRHTIAHTTLIHTHTHTTRGTNRKQYAMSRLIRFWSIAAPEKSNKSLSVALASSRHLFECTAYMCTRMRTQSPPFYRLHLCREQLFRGMANKICVWNDVCLLMTMYCVSCCAPRVAENPATWESTYRLQFTGSKLVYLLCVQLNKLLCHVLWGGDISFRI